VLITLSASVGELLEASAVGHAHRE
jgi:hypothetical protein